jgi:beta-phosphoglucomutase
MDMDGVLVDSEPILAEALDRLFAEKDVRVQPGDASPFLGCGEDAVIEGVAAKHGIALDLPRDKARLYALYLELIPGRLRAFPGVFGFLAEVRKRKLELALASSADDVKMEHNLREVGLSTSAFDAVVDGSNVARKKPFPDLFLEAAGRLGLPPDACLVVEDAVAGVEAAKAAGCRCLAVTNTFPAARLAAADWVVADLAHLPAGIWD